MKIAKILAIFVLALLVAGCASGPSPKNDKDGKANAKAVEAARLRVARFFDNLRVGMTVDEVEDVIGPINRDYKSLMLSLLAKAKQGMKITFENGTRGEMQVHTGDPDGHLKSLYTYHGSDFVLVFDWQGRLKEFRLEP